MANILKQLRKEKKMTQTQVGEYLNVTFQSYQKYETADIKTISTSTLLKLAKLFNVSINYLLGESEDKEGRKPKGIKIPVLGIIPAGIPIDAIEDILDYEEIPEELARTGEFFGLQVKGDSMEPDIRNNDIVIIKKQDNCETGDVCATMVNGDAATVKQVKRDNAGIWLVPFNKKYPPVFYDKKQIETLPVKIIGRVIEGRRKY